MLRLVHVVDVTPPAYMMTETASAVAIHFLLAEYQKALQEAGEKLLTTRVTTTREGAVNVDTKLVTVGMRGERIYEACWSIWCGGSATTGARCRPGPLLPGRSC